MKQTGQSTGIVKMAHWALIQLVVIIAGSLQLAWCIQNPQPMLTGDEAISALRARKDARAGVGYQILREFQPAEDGASLAKLAMEKAHAANTVLFLNGALVALLRDGGCLVVEYDRMTDRALAIHLVTRGEDGRNVINTEKMEGQTTIHEVRDVIEHTQTLLTKLFTTRSSELTALVKELFADIPDDESDGDPYFDVPPDVLALGSSQEVAELRDIQVRSAFWTFHYALSLPEYSANPEVALRTGYDRRNTLLDDFLAKKGISKAQLEDEPPAGLFNEPQLLKERLLLYRESLAYLEAHDVPEPPRALFSLNVSIATVPLEVFASDTDHGEPTLCGATASLFVPCWSRQRNGELRLLGLSAGGKCGGMSD